MGGGDAHRRGPDPRRGNRRTAGCSDVLGSEADGGAAVLAARRALPGWRALGARGRAPFLLAIADALEAVSAELAREISREVGMPLMLARRIQVDAPVAAWRATACAGGGFQLRA
ncbi:aldehyde dehydrogenase family protein [Cupriavidus basilensis]